MGKKKKILKKKPKQSFEIKGLTSIFSQEETFTKLFFTQTLIGLAVFLISFFIYLKTLTPTVGYHDSGDMTVAAYLLGIPHPPGYPLYCLLGKLFTCIPIGNIAYRLNLISGLCGALTVMMVYFIVMKMENGKWKVTEHGAKSKEQRAKNNEGETPYSILHAPCSMLTPLIPGVVAAFMLCFAITFWEQAVVAEKYTLNALFATLLIFILIKWQESIHSSQSAVRSPQSSIHNSQFTIHNSQFYLYLFTFLLGLSFTHHLQTIFLVPAGIYFIFITLGRNYKKILNPSFIIKTLILFVIPLCLYLYLPIRAKAQPLANWGDPSTFERFKEHITAEAYSGFFAMNTLLSNLIEHLSKFFVEQFTLLPLLIGLLGGIIFLIKRRHFAIALLIIVIADTLHSIRYTIPNIEDYYIPAFIVFSIWIGQGVAGIMEMGSKKVKELVYLLFLILPLFPLLTHYQYNARGGYYLPYDHCMNILNSLEKNAVLITKGDDDLFPIWYMQYIEKRRTDVAPFNMILFKNSWHIEQNKSRHPYLNLSIQPQKMVSSTNPQGDGLDDISRSRLVDTVERNCQTYPTYAYYIDCLSKNYSLVIEGLLCRVFPQSDGNKQLEGLDKHKDWLKITRGIYSGKIKDRRGVDTLKTYAMTYLNRGTTYFTMGKYQEAMEEFKSGVKIQPNSIELHYNLGGAYINLGRRDEAIGEFQKVLEIDPNYEPAKNALTSLTSR
ncbi:MAG: DUF2723 domain-containing protein [Nitrospirota bacterium]